MYYFLRLHFSSFNLKFTISTEHSFHTISIIYCRCRLIKPMLAFVLANIYEYLVGVRPQFFVIGESWYAASAVNDGCKFSIHCSRLTANSSVWNVRRRDFTTTLSSSPLKIKTTIMYFQLLLLQRFPIVAITVVALVRPSIITAAV